MKSFLPIVVSLALTAVFAPAALADSSTSSTPSATSSTPATTTTTSTTTETPPPAPTTTTTTTDVSPTTTTTTTDAVPTTTTTTVPTTTATTTTTGGDDLLPTDVVEACTEATCIPVDASGVGPAVATGTGSAGALPFTGITDVIAPVLLALTVLLGGAVAWRWAQLREAVARNGVVALEAPVGAQARQSGYQRALRMHQIDRRARSVFEPRMA